MGAEQEVVAVEEAAEPVVETAEGEGGEAEFDVVQRILDTESPDDAFKALDFELKQSGVESHSVSKDEWDAIKGNQPALRAVNNMRRKMLQATDTAARERRALEERAKQIEERAKQVEAQQARTLAFLQRLETTMPEAEADPEQAPDLFTDEGQKWLARKNAREEAKQIALEIAKAAKLEEEAIKAEAANLERSAEKAELAAIKDADPEAWNVMYPLMKHMVKEGGAHWREALQVARFAQSDPAGWDNIADQVEELAAGGMKWNLALELAQARAGLGRAKQAEPKPKQAARSRGRGIRQVIEHREAPDTPANLEGAALMRWYQENPDAYQRDQRKRKNGFSRWT